jgi:hypothetical protein
MICCLDFENYTLFGLRSRIYGTQADTKKCNNKFINVSRYSIYNSEFQFLLLRLLNCYNPEFLQNTFRNALFFDLSELPSCCNSDCIEIHK